MFGKKIVDHFLQKLDLLEYGQFELVTPDGHSRFFAGRNPGPSAKLQLHDWSVLSNMSAKGDVGLAEDYRSGLWETTDLENLLTLGLKNEHILSRYLFGNPLAKLKSRLSYLMRSNTLEGSKRNIHAHYDLGNKFYELWLDPTMTYSSAIFHTPQETLQQGQFNKYDRIINVLGGKQGNLLEIGCGWGGFADRVTTESDLIVKGITLSNEQCDFARKKLQNKAEIVLEDYRHQQGLFDYIVSIEMFEAVGEKYWQTYFNKVGSLLKKNGKAVIQTITINDNLFDKYRRSGDMIRSFIFPGGMLPSPTRFKQEAFKAGLMATNQFDFGLDYALTLKYWLKAFEAKESQIKDLGFDDGFIRLWRFYLASCIAGFQTGRANVMQIELSHA